MRITVSPNFYLRTMARAEIELYNFQSLKSPVMLKAGMAGMEAYHALRSSVTMVRGLCHYVLCAPHSGAIHPPV